MTTVASSTVNNFGDSFRPDSMLSTCVQMLASTAGDQNLFQAGIYSDQIVYVGVLNGPMTQRSPRCPAAVIPSNELVDQLIEAIAMCTKATTPVVSHIVTMDRDLDGATLYDAS